MNKGRLFNIVTWNINYSHRAVGEFAPFSFEERKEYVVSTLEALKRKRGVTLFMLQEVRTEYLQALSDVFPSSEYETFTHKASESAMRGAIYLFTAIPKTHDSMVMDHYIPPLDADFRECWQQISVRIGDGGTLNLVNIHAPMDKKFREPILKHIAKHAHQHYYCVLAGDFNSFSDDGSAELITQMEQYNRFKDANSLMLRGDLWSDNFDEEVPCVRVHTTFLAYPYDTVPTDYLRYFPYHLDHIMVSAGIKQHGIALCFDGDRPITFRDHTYGASDHFPVALTIDI